MLLSTGPHSRGSNNRSKNIRANWAHIPRKMSGYLVGSLGMRERGRGSPHIPPRCCHRFTWYNEVVHAGSRSKQRQLACDALCFSSGSHTTQSLVPDFFVLPFLCLCAQRRSLWTGPHCTPPRKRRRQRNTWPLFALPTLGAGGRETLLFSFQICP